MSTPLTSASLARKDALDRVERSSPPPCDWKIVPASAYTAQSMCASSSGSVLAYPRSAAREEVVASLGSPIPATSMGPMSHVSAMQIPVDGSTASYKMLCADAAKSGPTSLAPLCASQLSYEPLRTAAGAMASAVASS